MCGTEGIAAFWVAADVFVALLYELFLATVACGSSLWLLNLCVSTSFARCKYAASVAVIAVILYSVEHKAITGGCLQCCDG
jgi:hypothetical protein